MEGEIPPLFFIKNPYNLFIKRIGLYIVSATFHLILGGYYAKISTQDGE